MRRYGFLNTIASRFSFTKLLHANPHQIIPLFYHAVGNVEDSSHLKGLYQVPSAHQFEKDIDFILKYLQPIELTTLIEHTNGKTLKGNEKYFFLSFDDGLNECKEFIAPILKRKGIPATFFINPDFVGRKIRFHRFTTNLLAQKILLEKNLSLEVAVNDVLGTREKHSKSTAAQLLTIRYNQQDKLEALEKILYDFMGTELNAQKAYMNKEDIQDLVNAGFTIGAHSLDHPEYYLLSEEEQLRQTIESVKLVSDWFNVSYRAFSFPFSDVGVKSSFFERLNKEFPLDITFGSSGLKKDTLANHIHRIPMDDIALEAELRLKTELLYYQLKRPFGKNIYKRS
jgi:peptidoglycan/xylan/chitin deacetylase (PgdA/CDA1 family)